jgi:SAM-dependent methyltransferase
MKLNHYNINFNFSNFGTVYKIISLNKSIMRITHNLFLRNKKISGRIANVGSGANIDLKNMFKEVNGKIYNYDYFKYNKNVTRVNLEKKINLSKNKFDFIILFNVLEHIENYKNLINNLKYYLKKKGTLEIFVPFMFRFHEDPKDYFRPTHFYLQKLLSRKKFFSIKTTLIAAGPMMTVLEILFKYLKFKIVKIIFLFFFIILDKIFFKLSKDYLNYYCGFHISCKRL